MGGFLPYEEADVAEYDLTPAVHSLGQIAQVERVARASERAVRYHLKIDSGMGRLGTRASAEEILAALGQAPDAQLEGLMTHFASAADYTKKQTGEQLDYFERICARLEQAGVKPPYCESARGWSRPVSSHHTGTLQALSRWAMDGARAGTRWCGWGRRCMATFRRPAARRRGSCWT